MKTAINNASSTIFVSPAATVIISPSLGFSAVIKRLWNTLCNINAVLNIIRVLPYVTQSSSICPLAPNACESGRTTISPKIVSNIPKITTNVISIVKYLLASSFLFSPSVFATNALPPVPIINPNAPNIIKNGQTKFTAANGVFPTKLDTNVPSTTP